jgi:multiple sugar transport system ATP-binding protein
MMKTTIVYVTHDQIEAMTLATRIAVMRNGRIEQLGTPEEIYNRPATLYVASFVGAPPINLLQVTKSGHGLKVEGTDLVLPLPAGMAEGVREGQRLVAGIRPESLRRQAEGASLPVRCDVVELTGPELVVTGLVGEQRLVATLPPANPPSPGDVLALGAEPGSLHLFDPQTELRVD